MTNDDSRIALIKGGGDLGTGVALRLRQQGWRVVVTELAQPLVVRRAVAVASAIYEGQVTVEGVTAICAQNTADVLAAWDVGHVPVMVAPAADMVREFEPWLVVDAIMGKRNIGTTLTDAPLVVALGPGFTAGVDCHAVIETQRGPNLGRVYLTGSAAPDSGVPGEVGGETIRRLLRAPIEGTFTGLARIGDHVLVGQIVAEVAGSCRNGYSILAEIKGVLRGLLADGVRVQAGVKVGDIEPRDDPALCFRVSDKAWAIGDGVLQAVRLAEANA